MFVDMARGEVLEVIDHGVVPLPARAAAATAPTTSARCATTSSRSRSRSPTVRASRSTATCVRWQSWSLRVSHGPVRGPGAAHGRLRGRRPGPARPAPGVDHRDGRALRRSRPDARLEERLRRGRVGPRPHGQLAHARAATASARSTTSTRRSPPSRASRARSPTRSACTRRTTGSSGSTSTCTPARTEVRRSRRLVVSSIATVGNYEYGFYWYFYLDGTIQLEVKLTGIMSTDGRRARRAARATRSWSRRSWPRRTTSTCSTSGSTSTSTARRTRSTRSTPSRCPPAPTTRGPTPSRAVATPLATEQAGAARRSTRRRSRTLEDRQPRACATGSASRSAYKLVPGVDPDAAGRPRARASAAGPASPPTTCGSRRTAPTSDGPPATTRTSTPVATACRAGRRPTGRSSTPTSCSGTRSASPTSRAPRTGR